MDIPHPRRSLRPLLHVLAITLIVAGCGGGDDSSSGGGSSGKGDMAAAKKSFVSTCGGCHTLADAGTSGSFGPNLDDLGPDEGRVRSQIETGGGGMPSGLLSGKKADAVAAYVSASAGK